VTLEQEEPFGDIDVAHVEGAPAFVTDGVEFSSADEGATDAVPDAPAATPDVTDATREGE